MRNGNHALMDGSVMTDNCVYTESSYMFQSSYKTMEIVLHITFHLAEASAVSCWRQKWVCTMFEVEAELGEELR